MRCFLSPECWRHPSPALSREESHYATHVLRAAVGDAIEVFDGQGRVAPARIDRIERRLVTVEIGPTRHIDAPTPTLHLLQAVPKSVKIDWILQKGTELGMGVLSPLITHQGTVRLDPARASAKAERWRDIALNAARQCGRAWVPTITPVMGLPDALQPAVRPECLLVAALRPHAQGLAQALRGTQDLSPASIGILIGPEGDFSDDEYRMMDQAGVIPVSLGPTVLRTETAALYALSILRYEFR